MRPGTLSDMTTAHRRENRVLYAVRLTPSGLDRIKDLAVQETEGNVSAMIRKLITEAIRARRAAE